MATHAFGSRVRTAKRPGASPVRILFACVLLLLTTVSTLGAATVTAAWDPNPESNIAGYKLSYGTQSGVYTTVVDVGKVTSWPLTLGGPRRYYFAMQAYNTLGAISPYSTEVFFDIPGGTPPSVTAQPINQSVSAGQTALFTVAASGTPTPSYQWQLSTNGGSSWSSLSNGSPFSGVATATLAVSGMTSGMSGTRFRCIATNTVGSATSNPATLMFRKQGAPADFDGDGKSDIAVYRPSTGTWFVERSSTNNTTFFSTAWGMSTDVSVPGDYDGDGKADLAVYRPSTGNWFILQSSSNYTTYVTVNWGVSTDIPVPGDYDGDGKSDIAVYRPSTGTWFIERSSTNNITFFSTAWGVSTDIPVPGDYDGDGKADLAVYRPSSGMWYILQSSSNYATYTATQWGLSADIPVRGDYDGDGKADLALYRPSSGMWYVLSNYTTSTVTQWGMSTDIPVPGDFDGDGKTDLAVYRPSSGTWYLRSSISNTMSTYAWGLSTDVALHP